jgi:hypothetical protein
MPPFTPGQQVVWTYLPQQSPRTVSYIAAEVVHAGPLRVRIRIHDTQGHTLLRWVKPNRLRPKQPNEPAGLYPESGKSR